MYMLHKYANWYNKQNNTNNNTNCYKLIEINYILLNGLYIDNKQEKKVGYYYYNLKTVHIQYLNKNE